MKVKIFAVVFCAVLLAGCTWAEVEQGAGKVQTGATKVELVGTAVGPYTQGWGGLVGALASVVVGGAGAVAAFAKSKKAKQVARAAVEAANETTGGGQALVNAAVSNGVASDIRKIYNAFK